MAQPSSGSESSPHYVVFLMTGDEARSQKWQYRFFAHACWALLIVLFFAFSGQLTITSIIGGGRRSGFA
jgi:hypothetical protein